MSSFEDLYTFADVASMYNIDQSTLRRNMLKLDLLMEKMQRS